MVTPTEFHLGDEFYQPTLGLTAIIQGYDAKDVIRPVSARRQFHAAQALFVDCRIVADRPELRLSRRPSLDGGFLR